jgi:hypothetical protein
MARKSGCASAILKNWSWIRGFKLMMFPCKIQYYSCTLFPKDLLVEGLHIKSLILLCSVFSIPCSSDWFPRNTRREVKVHKGPQFVIFSISHEVILYVQIQDTSTFLEVVHWCRKCLLHLWPYKKYISENMYQYFLIFCSLCYKTFWHCRTDLYWCRWVRTHLYWCRWVRTHLYWFSWGEKYKGNKL